MKSTDSESDFTPSLGCLLEPPLVELAAQLRSIEGLSSHERETIQQQTRASLYAVLHGKLARLLLLELNAARVEGRLRGKDMFERWADFLRLSSSLDFWDGLAQHYLSLRRRIDRIVRNRSMASLLFAKRWASDRTDLAVLCGRPPGELEELSFGAGDSHCGGLSVARLRCPGGRLVYKPRSVAVDAALQNFVDELAGDSEAALSVRVPKVVARADYGWTEFVEHCYAADDTELRTFYRGIGHWLAIMHLLGASDLHAENLIANGPTPIVVDCETLFTPKKPMPPSGLGQALDKASELIANTVLSIGLLPGRAQTLGWRGVDYSGMGALPEQQPMISVPTILKAGTDEAHLGMALAPLPEVQNLPRREPTLALFWPEVTGAFAQTTAVLRRLDAAGVLRERLQKFAECRVRVVLRGTEAYTEIARMLWHPVSLHNEDVAKGNAAGLLRKMAANLATAPTDPAVIDAEIEDLLVGDIPFFSTVVCDGRLQGPHGTSWLNRADLAESALQRWRASDSDFELDIVRAAMISAYLNDGWTGHMGVQFPESVRTEDLDARRRAQAARIVHGLVKHAMRETDGSVAWIAPTFSPAGWSVQPLAMDMYAGLSGVALLAGAYLRETRAGRADPVEGLEDLFEATRLTLRLAENKAKSAIGNGTGKIRPAPPGGYVGLGSQIWTLLLLSHWNRGEGDELARACALVEELAPAVRADDMHDVLTGKAGAIPALLALHEKTGNRRFLDIARELGNELCDLANRKDGLACWPHPNKWPEGIGGFSHGVTGIGWALSKLARATGDVRFEQTAEAAFAFEDTLFDDEEENWLDLRDIGGPKSLAVWCHGAVGIGLAHLDLDPHFRSPRTRPLLRRAMNAAVQKGLGRNHCLCHGDMGAWELIDRAITLGESPPGGLTQETLMAQIVTSLEENGPICGLTKEVFVPGLLPGVGGVAYQLLRAHPDSRLPSVLTLASDGF